MPVMPTMPRSTRNFSIGLNIDALLHRHDMETKAYETASTTRMTEEEDSYSDDSSYDDGSSMSSYDSSDSDNDSDLDEGVFFGELQSWMEKLTISKRVPRRTNSMHLLGAVNVMPKYKEAIHHPLVANRIRKCDAEFFQSADEVATTRQAKQDPSTEKPEDVLASILAAAGVTDTSQLAPAEGEFLQVTEERVSAHCKELTDAARNSNLKLLKQFHKNGRNLEACNRFGESIVAIVCRRGSAEVLNFLINTAHASLMVRDDFGRTPLHDAAWTDKPSFALVKILLKNSPKTLFTKDSRGSTPLAYIPRPRWGVWNAFLNEHRSLVLAAAAAAN